MIKGTCYIMNKYTMLIYAQLGDVCSMTGVIGKSKLFGFHYVVDDVLHYVIDRP